MRNNGIHIAILFAGRLRMTLTLFLLALAASSCVEEYWPEIGLKYENALVVDGMITDEPGPYTIRLSRSSAVSNPEFLPMINCEVTILDNLGNSETLFETTDGVYMTHPDGIRGEPGRSYRLMIRLPNEKLYMSDFEPLTSSTGIDSIYHKVEYREVIDDDHPEVGLQFYLDTDMAEQDTNFYLWRLESSFKYKANHLARFIFDGEMERFHPYDSLLTCWWTGSARQIFTYSTESLNQPVIKGFPLNFVNTETKALSIRYSLHVNQLSITRKAYNFYHSLEDLDSESGSLFAKQPYQVRGNVYSTDDEDEPVLGYFIVAGSSKKRIFVDRPFGLEFYYRRECNLITQELYTLLWSMVSSWPIILTAVATENGFQAAYVADPGCIDCREEYEGARLTPPDFWIE
jgi:hypothetical protein